MNDLNFENLIVNEEFTPKLLKYALDQCPF